MHILVVAAVTAALISASEAAGQAISTFGSSTAEACYESARDQRSGQADLINCDQALQGMLLPADLVATYVNRGILFALRGNYDRALNDYDKAISLDPGVAEAFLNKGLLYLRMPEHERKAVAVIDVAIAKNTRELALAYFARAIAHEGLGDLNAALNDYQQAATLAPKWKPPARELRRFRPKG